jgi:hypothetical protein
MPESAGSPPRAPIPGTAPFIWQPFAKALVFLVALRCQFLVAPTVSGRGFFVVNWTSVRLELNLTDFIVIDCRPSPKTKTRTITARNPEDAAKQVFAVDLVRSGQRAENLVCRVYWQEGNMKSMVRLYHKSSNRISYPPVISPKSSS